jgi:hypothetical protein
MFTKMTSYLVFTAVFLFHAVTGEAQSGFAIRKVPNSDNLLMFFASSGAGGGVFSAYEDSEGSIILTGANGYRRNLTNVLRKINTNDWFAPVKISSDGSVVFRRMRRLSDGPFVDFQFLQVPFESSEIKVLADLSPPGSSTREVGVNNKGHVVIAESKPDEASGEVLLIKTYDGKQVPQKFRFPNTTPDQKGVPQYISVFLDDDGAFLLARRVKIKSYPEFVDICTGSLFTTDSRCATRGQLKALSADKAGDINFLKEGRFDLLLRKKVTLINASNYSKIAEYPIMYSKNVVVGPLYSDDASVSAGN